MPISEELLSILVCPQCRKDLEYDRVLDALTCASCGLRYKIVDGIPNMLVEEAERIQKG
jgi:hypothetical protein